MGFLSYIQNREGQEMASGGRMLRMKRPVVNFLLGDFNGPEREALAFYPQQYANADKCIFWCTVGEETHEITREGDFSLPTPAGAQRYGLRARAALKAWADPESAKAKEGGRDAGARREADGADGSGSGYDRTQQEAGTEDTGSLRWERMRQERREEPAANLRDSLQNLSDQVFNRAAQGGVHFTNSGSLAINILVKSDEAAAGLLEPLIREAVQAFQMYYNSEILTDVYLFTDQRGLREMAEERRASNYLTLCETDRQMKEKNLHLSWFLSNYDSKGRVRPDYEQESGRAFGMLLLLKNAVSGGADLHLYSDDDFMSAITAQGWYNADHKAGMFASLGYMSLESNEFLARLSAYRAVFDEMRQIREEMPVKRYIEELELDDWHGALKPANSSLTFTEADWRAIPRDTGLQEAGMIGMPNGDCIERLYGDRLDLFLDLNCGRTEARQRAAGDWVRSLEKKFAELGGRERLSPFEASLILDQVQANLKEQTEQCKKRRDGSRAALEKWKDSRCGNLDKAKMPVTKESRTVFTQASEYIRRLLAVKNDESRYQLCIGLESELASLMKRFAEYGALIQDASEELTGKIRSIIEETSPEKSLQVENSDVYYAAVAHDILQNSREYQIMCGEVRGRVFDGALRKETAEEIYRKVYRFCDEQLIHSLGFHREFMDEIFSRLLDYRTKNAVELKNDNAIADYVLYTIDQDCQYYMARSIYSTPKVNETLCFLLDPDSKFARANSGADEAHAVALIKSNKLKLFCEKGREKLEVLFMAGNLQLEELYQFFNYEEAYEKLTKEVG